MSNQNRRTLGTIFDLMGEALDVPPSKYQDAKDRYEAVGDWLGDDDSELAPFRPVISPQGSFALGTAVRPLGDDDYDLDAVCELQLLTPNQITQQELKEFVGARLKHPKSRYRQMIDPPQGGRRCWTIKYADSSQFHLDVLPAVPDDYEWLVRLGVPEELAATAIRLTDRKAWQQGLDWPRSNPKGYAAWFKGRMRARLQEAKLALANEIRSEVKDIEDFRVRTPLQRLVQLLKRHRDVRYNGDEDKPISILITTLAAQAYDNEPTVLDALTKVVPTMREGVVRRGGVLWVANPVNPQENFADKWAEKPRKARLFLEWLGTVERECRDILQDLRRDRLVAYLSESFGDRETATVLAKHDLDKLGKGASVVGPAILIPSKESRSPRTVVRTPANPPRSWRP